MREPRLPSLKDAALFYLSRYATTEAGLRAVLHRKIANWARHMANSAGHSPEEIAAITTPAKQAATEIAQSLTTAGIINDQIFAVSRAKILTRSGRSRRATMAHLAAKGVKADLIQQSLVSDPRAELAAALIHAKKRRLGPFATTPITPDSRKRALSSLARAGFSGETASRALRMEHGEAEELIIDFRASL